jgi:phage-related protein (TIGR01555 family)
MLAKLRQRLAALIAPPAPAAVAAPKLKPRSIPRALLQNFSAHVEPAPGPYREYRAPDLPPGVVPDSSKLAMDGAPVITGEPARMALDSCAPNYSFLGATQGFGNGLWFPGYPYLAELTQISEYRAPSETTSTEMTRKWFELQSKSGGDKSEVISQIIAACDEFKVREHFRRCAKLDGEFGRGQIYLNINDADDLRRQLPLELTPQGVPKGSLKLIQSFEPYWSTPYSWNAAYPEREDFYKPVSWYIMGRKTHSDRILTFIGREVPDLLKPSYNFSGISLTQLMEPYVNAWLRTRKAVNDLINNFSIPVLSTDLNATLEDGGTEGSGLLARLNIFTSTRNNQMVAAIQKDEEELAFAEATLASLDKLQAQSQEHMAAPAHVPLIKLFGVVPTGLNATGEGEIQVWYDWINASQVNLFQPHLEKLLKVIQLHLFGEIDDDLVVHWVTLDEPTVKEQSEIRKSDADADAVYITNGVIDPAEARTRLQTDPDSGYTNLTGGPPEPPEPAEPSVDPNTALTIAHESSEADKQREHETAMAGSK